MLARIAPALFVLIWSSGFVVARWAVPHAAPELILLARMVLTSALMGAIALYTRASWPRGRRLAMHLLAGALLNGVYLCTSWWAIERHMPAGVMSLLGALQPLVVAVGSFFVLKERLPIRGWAGLGVGLIGVAMVLTPLLGHSLGAPVPGYVVAGAVSAILAMSAGVMIQRGQLSQDNLMVSSSIQNIGGAAVALLATLMLGEYRWDNSPTLWAGVIWSVLMLSAAALSLLVWMTRSQGATRVSLLLLLVPPLTAVETWILFGEHLVALQILGFGLALGGVLLARAASKPSAVQAA
jgi:drug/metabolite transporter (DMT)-like permease